MPRIDYSKMPYDKIVSAGERVLHGGFYYLNNNVEESSDIYRGYYTYNYFGIEFYDDDTDADIPDKY